MFTSDMVYGNCGSKYSLSSFRYYQVVLTSCKYIKYDEWWEQLLDLREKLFEQLGKQMMSMIE